MKAQVSCRRGSLPVFVHENWESGKRARRLPQARLSYPFPQTLEAPRCLSSHTPSVLDPRTKSVALMALMLAVQGHFPGTSPPGNANHEAGWELGAGGRKVTLVWSELVCLGELGWVCEI